MVTNNAINTGILASSSDVKAGTSTTKIVNPASMQNYMADLINTGFESWSAGGPFWSLTGTQFNLLVGGTGYIQGKLITWLGGQNTGALAAGSTYYVYIDSSGTIGTTSTRTDALYQNDIVLFEVLVDSAGSPNVIVTKENHPYSFSTSSSNYLHNTAGTVIENFNNGANITLNGTQSIQINGADTLNDHGLQMSIPDSGGVAVTFRFMYTNGAGKWVQNTTATVFPSSWNSAGTITALTANRFATFRLFVAKDSLNTSTPEYYAIYDTSEYTSQANANAAITAGTTATSTAELQQLELCQLGFVTVRQSTGLITNVVINKSTLRSTISGASSTSANLITTSTTNFNGWLSSADTTVQAALDTLDDSQRFIEVTAASANLAINQGVIANRGTLVTLTLPTVANLGDTIEVVGKGTGGWKIAQNANQQIDIIGSHTTNGAGGSLASTLQYDAVRLVCTVANLEFTALSTMGNLTIV